MTLEEWQGLQAGDRIRDNGRDGVVREILAVRRISGRKEQRGLTRTELALRSLRDPYSRTLVHFSENTGPARFDLVREDEAS